MPLAFLLAMQASGMVVDWLGKNEQIRLGKMGAQIEEEGINANIQTSRLESEDASLQAMKQLRMNLGTQAAMLAARGVRSGTQTSVISMNTSVGNFNADERMRRINQIGREANLRAGKLTSQLHQKTFENNIRAEFRNNLFSKIPTSPSAYSQIGSSFGLTKTGG